VPLVFQETAMRNLNTEELRQIYGGGGKCGSGGSGGSRASGTGGSSHASKSGGSHVSKSTKTKSQHSK
jgi:bacteriocin-like protein